MIAVFMEVGVFDMPEDSEIKAGTVVVVPHPKGKEITRLPFTLLMAGQMLNRSLYPVLSRAYSGTGGGDFNHIWLENLERKFFMGFDENNEPIMGSGLVYYEDVKWNHVEEEFDGQRLDEVLTSDAPGQRHLSS